MGGLARGVLGRLDQILHCPVPVAAFLKVHGQFRSDLVHPITVNHHSLFGDAPMDLRTAHWRDHSVRHFSVEHMDKTMSRGNTSIW